MSKVSNAILMLEYLNTGNKYSVKELSEKIGVTERMVKYYKDVLQDAGIYIESFMGPNGGYFLTKNNNSYKQFTKYDIQLLETSLLELKKNKFEFIDKYESMVTKVKKSFAIEEEKSKFDADVDNEDNSLFFSIIENKLNNKERTNIVYQDLNGLLKERWIYPLQIFKFDNKIFITSFCELRNDIRHFELNRIKKINQ